MAFIFAYQLMEWKESARNAIGNSASFGIAVGGAAATAAGAVDAFARGIFQGATSAASGQGGQVALAPLPPPVPDPPWTRSLPIRRPSSTGDLGNIVSELCPKCDLGKKGAHMYRGSCRGYPKEFYFPPKGFSRSTAAASAAQSEVVTLPRAEENTTELARRTEQSR